MYDRLIACRATLISSLALIVGCQTTAADVVRDPDTGQPVCDVTHSLRAANWATAPGSEAYPCFVFRSPFTEQSRALAWAPRIDRVDLIHHFTLHRTTTPMNEGVYESCSIPRDARLLVIWSPGDGAVVMPPDVGMELSSGDEEWLILAPHYLNVGAPGTHDTDASGVDLCVTEAPIGATAGVIVMGTAEIDIPPLVAGFPVETTCSQRQDFPLTAIATSAHMHARGRAITSEVIREGETVAMLANEPAFDPDLQRTRSLSPGVVLQPGDRIRTTCVYDNDSSDTIRYGVRTQDEMCFDYVLAYPIDRWPDEYSRVCW